MNTFLPSRYSERVFRLALGLEPWDPIRARRVRVPLDVTIESPQSLSVVHHDSALRTLVYGVGVDSPIQILVADARRRFVPRRVGLPIRSEQEVLDGEDTPPEVPLAERIRRLALFPGAAYDIPTRTTALRGRVVQGDEPLRWARVEAGLPGGDVLWRAHGDDRGEFLLVIGRDPDNFGELTPGMTMTVEVTVTGPDPIPDPPADPLGNPHADLPLEDAPPPGGPDPVSPGIDLPADYQPGLSEVREVELPLGRVSSDPLPFEPS